MLIRALAGLTALAILCLPVHAQDAGDFFSSEPRKHVPGEFDYYALVLSWSPTYLHGLWPQYEKGYPERCRTHWRPFVPEEVIDGMRDVMPSRGLIIHEYRTHGTCSGLMPKFFFDLARRFYERIGIPERYANPYEVQVVSPQELMRELLQANPWLSPDAVVITCGGPGNRLRELRFCFAKDGRLRSWGADERQRAACRASTMYVPPVRSKQKVFGGRNWHPPQNERTLPMPRIETPK
jgi:ribonuclease T2